jgi:hypothetical protein
VIWISLLHNVSKRVRNRNARFRFVFGIKFGLVKVRRILRIWLCAYLLSSKFHDIFLLYTTFGGLVFQVFGEFRLGYVRLG